MKVTVSFSVCQKVVFSCYSQLLFDLMSLFYTEEFCMLIKYFPWVVLGLWPGFIIIIIKSFLFIPTLIYIHFAGFRTVKIEYTESKNVRPSQLNSKSCHTPSCRKNWGHDLIVLSCSLVRTGQWLPLLGNNVATNLLHCECFERIAMSQICHISICNLPVVGFPEGLHSFWEPHIFEMDMGHNFFLHFIHHLPGGCQKMNQIKTHFMFQSLHLSDEILAQWGHILKEA